MAAKNNTEIRIPVIIDLQPRTQAGVAKPITNNAGGTLTRSQVTGQAISAGFLIQSGQKLIAATGNTQVSKAIGDTVKYGTLGIRAFGGDFTALASMAIDLGSEAIKKVNQLRQEAEVNNQAKYNQLLNGQQFLGSGQISISRNIWGEKSYNVTK